MALAFVSTGVHITDRHSMFFRPDLESTLQPMNSSSRKRLSRRRREVPAMSRTNPNHRRFWGPKPLRTVGDRRKARPHGADARDYAVFGRRFKLPIGRILLS